MVMAQEKILDKIRKLIDEFMEIQKQEYPYNKFTFHELSKIQDFIMENLFQAALKNEIYQEHNSYLDMLLKAQTQKIFTFSPILKNIQEYKRLTKSDFENYINSKNNKKYSATKKEAIMDIIENTDFHNSSLHENALKAFFLIHLINDKVLFEVISFGKHLKGHNLISHYTLCCLLHKRLKTYKSRKKHKYSLSQIMNSFCHSYTLLTNNKTTALDIINYFKNLFEFKKANSTLTGDYKRTVRTNTKKLDIFLTF
jgi:hypothetical protein